MELELELERWRCLARARRGRGPVPCSAGLLDALRDTQANKAAVAQTTATLREALYASTTPVAGK